MVYSSIIATGSYSPKRILTNKNFEDALKNIYSEDPKKWTNNQWITDRTGIDKRFVAEPEETNKTMAWESTKNALESIKGVSGFKLSDIGMIIHGTNTSVQPWPASASYVQNKIQEMISKETEPSENKVLIPFADVQAGCTGFGFGLDWLASLIESGRGNSGIVTGVDVLTSITDYSDRSMCILFGDGAGTFILGKTEKPGIIKSCLKGDGSYAKHLKLVTKIVPTWIAFEELQKQEKAITYQEMLKILENPEKGIEQILERPGKEVIRELAEKYGGRIPLFEKRNFMYMDGRRIFEFATNMMAEILFELIDLDHDKNLKKMRDVYESIALITPHQANYRIHEGASERFAKLMKIANPDERKRFVRDMLDKTAATVRDHGNTSTASTPVSFDKYLRGGKIKDGDRVLFVYFGAGATAAGHFMEYHNHNHYDRETGFFSYRKAA